MTNISIVIFIFISYIAVGFLYLVFIVLWNKQNTFTFERKFKTQNPNPSPACFPKKKAMIDKEKTPINVSNCASDNMVKENIVKESVEKVHETAVVTSVKVEQAVSSLSPALSSSMIEGSRSALVMNSGSGLLQGNLPTLTKTSVDTSQSQVKSLENATTTLTNISTETSKIVEDEKQASGICHPVMNDSVTSKSNENHCESMNIKENYRKTLKFNVNLSI